MQKKHERAKLTLLTFLCVGLAYYFSAGFITSLPDARANIGISLYSDFKIILFNFILFYVLGGLLSYLTYHVIDQMPVKRLTKPLQITCIMAMVTQMLGSLAYISYWHEALQELSAVVMQTHYLGLIGISIIQLTIFVNFWIDDYVGYMDKFRVLGRTHYSNRHTAPKHKA